MVYAVELTLRAERDLNELYEYLAAANSEAARQWFNRLERAIYTLERFPSRFPRAPKARKSRRPLRQLLYGTKLNTYRVLYEINEAHKKVRVVSIRHGALDAFAAKFRLRAAAGGDTASNPTKLAERRRPLAQRYAGRSKSLCYTFGSNHMHRAGFTLNRSAESTNAYQADRENLA